MPNNAFAVRPAPPTFNFWDNTAIYLVDVTDPQNPVTEVHVDKEYWAVVEVVNTTDGGTARDVIVQVAVCDPSSNFVCHNDPTRPEDTELEMVSSMGHWLENQVPVTITTQPVQVTCTIGTLSGWVPQPKDLEINPSGHYCMAVNCVSPTEGTSFNSVVFEPNKPNPLQGQRNFGILPAEKIGGRQFLRYNFYAGNALRGGAPQKATLVVLRSDPSVPLRPAEIDMVKKSALGHPNPKPSQNLPKSARLVPSPELRAGCLGWLLGGGQSTPGPAPPPVPGDVLTKIGLDISPNTRGLVTVELELSSSDSPGDVHPLDLLQFDSTGAVQGGFRLLGVVRT